MTRNELKDLIFESLRTYDPSIPLSENTKIGRYDDQWGDDQIYDSEFIMDIVDIWIDEGEYPFNPDDFNKDMKVGQLIDLYMSKFENIDICRLEV